MKPQPVSIGGLPGTGLLIGLAQSMVVERLLVRVAGLLNPSRPPLDTGGADRATTSLPPDKGGWGGFLTATQGRYRWEPII